MIREIRTSDAASIRHICDIALGYDASLDLVSRQIEKLSQDRGYHFIYVYQNEACGQVLGFIHAELYESLYSDQGLNILGLAVDPKYQGQGIGKQLLRVLEQEAVTKQIQFIRLNSASKRLKAHQFYEHLGYICDKTQKRFIKIFQE